MKKMALMAALLCSGWLLQAQAAGPGKAGKADKALAGHYYLQGVREMGSELLLKADGRFEWAISYGAMDQYAKGSWRVNAGKVVLQTTSTDKDPVFRPFRDEEMRVRKPAEDGYWVAIVGMPGVGPMRGVEVTFESASGKTATAVSDRAGDAMVEMPASETWARAGLRREGSKAPLQWFDLAPDRAGQRLSAFAVDDIDYVREQPFQRLTLTVKGDKLVMEEGGGGLVYQRQ